MKLDPELSEAEENPSWCMNVAYVMELSLFLKNYLKCRDPKITLNLSLVLHGVYKG